MMIASDKKANHEPFFETEKRWLTQTSLEMLWKDVALERIAGFGDLEQLKLGNGEEGGPSDFTGETRLRR